MGPERGREAQPYQYRQGQSSFDDTILSQLPLNVVTVVLVPSEPGPLCVDVGARPLVRTVIHVAFGADTSSR